MSKRVQVTLSDEEFEALFELSELRGESMSLILGAEVASSRLLWQWRQEAAARQIAARKFEAAERQLESRVSKLRG
jgi:hypothetical protein